MQKQPYEAVEGGRDNGTDNKLAHFLLFNNEILFYRHKSDDTYSTPATTISKLVRIVLCPVLKTNFHFVSIFIPSELQ